ncbi:MAG TPA: hypothetical protein VJU58_04010 [Microbacterium sp.]|nr:hypothetical protein [Microbacterium sp.]
MRKIDDLIARSSVGAALRDIKERGLAAHLKDLEREMHPRRRAPCSACAFHRRTRGVACLKHTRRGERAARARSIGVVR